MAQLRETQELTPELRRRLLREVEDTSGSMVESLFDFLDMPAKAVRSAYTGKKNASVSDAAKYLLGSAYPKQDTLGGWGRTVADVAVGSVLDPLSYVGFGPATRAGKIVAKAGLTDDIAKAAGRKAAKAMASTADDDTLRTLLKSGIPGIEKSYAGSAVAGWGKADQIAGVTNDLGKVMPIDEWDLDAVRSSLGKLKPDHFAVRNLVGPRQSAKTTTLREVAQQAPGNLAKLRTAAESSGAKLDDLLDSTLKNDIGVWIPGYGTVGTNLGSVGTGISQTLDRAGQALRWSPVGRGFAQGFSKANSSKFDEADQLASQYINRGMARGEQAGKAYTSTLMSQLKDGDFGHAIQSHVRRALERVNKADNPLFDADLEQIKKLGGSNELLDFIRGSDEMLEGELKLKKLAGLPAERLKDDAISYFPRSASPDTLQKSFSKARAATTNTSTPDQIARKDYLKNIPGGTEYINELSIDSMVAGPKRTLRTDAEAADYIRERFAAGVTPGESAGDIAEKLRRFRKGEHQFDPDAVTIPRKDAMSIARMLHHMDEKAVSPLFGNSWASDLERSIVGTRRAAGASNAIMDLLANAARNGHYSKVKGGEHIPMSTALKRLGLKTHELTSMVDGAEQKWRVGAKPALARRMGTKPNQVLKTSVHKERVNSLLRLADIAKEPAFLTTILENAVDPIIRVWKASILAWPARFTRDWLSGVFVNAVEVDNPLHLVKGYQIQNALMQGNLDAVVEQVSGFARYAGKSGDDLLKELQKDMTLSGILEGKSALDLGGRASALESSSEFLSHYRPGAQPTPTLFSSLLDGGKNFTQTAGYKAFVNDGTPRSMASRVGDFFHVGLMDPRDVRSPILKWSAEAGNRTDQINRGAGFFALLQEGYDPVEAGRKMLAGHVDYDSLTQFERSIMRRIVPFWSYQSRIGAWVASKIAENPGGRYTQMMIRGPQTAMESSNSDDYVPQSIRQTYGFELPEGGLGDMLSTPFGKAKPGVSQWLNDFDLPGIDAINTIIPKFDRNGSLDLLGTAGATIGDFVADTNPLLKNAYEAATGTSTFTKRPWKDSDTVLQDLLSKAGIPKESTAGLFVKRLDPIVQMAPIVGSQRALQTINRLADSDRVEDPRDRLVQSLVNAASGVKTQNVSPDVRDIDARTRIKQLLEDDPHTSQVVSTYIPESDKPFVDPEVELLLELDRVLGRELKDRKLIRQALEKRGQR